MPYSKDIPAASTQINITMSDIDCQRKSLTMLSICSKIWFRHSTQTRGIRVQTMHVIEIDYLVLQPEEGLILGNGHLSVYTRKLVKSSGGLEKAMCGIEDST